MEIKNAKHFILETYFDKELHYECHDRWKAQNVQMPRGHFPHTLSTLFPHNTLWMKEWAFDKSATFLGWNGKTKRKIIFEITCVQLILLYHDFIDCEINGRGAYLRSERLDSSSPCCQLKHLGIFCHGGILTSKLHKFSVDCILSKSFRKYTCDRQLNHAVFVISWIIFQLWKKSSILLCVIMKRSASCALTIHQL